MKSVGISTLVLLSLLTAVEVAGHFACGSSGWTVTIPSDAYAWGDQPPQGCTCKITDVALTECGIFDCGCICDLTAGKCDTNCCCDSECTDIDQERFAELDSCLDEGPVDEITNHCYSTDSLDAINPRYPLSGGGAAQDALDGLLCVQYDNSESKGEYYEDPGVLATSAFSDDSGTSEFSYHDLLTAATATGSTEGDAYFDKGDRIPAAFLTDDSGTVAAFGGYLPLPIADDSGYCNYANFAEFEVSIPAFAGNGHENVCATEAHSLEDECAIKFGWGFLSEDLYIGTTGTISPSETFDGDDYIQVVVSSMLWRDWDTGLEVSFSDANCDAFYYDPREAAGEEDTSYVNCLIGGESGDTFGTSTEVATEGCYNALASVCYTVKHNGAGTISAVTAALVITDIPPGLNGSTSSAILSQQFSVEFQLDETADEALTRTQDLGNLIRRARSGNPGYLVGLPLLSGSLESSGSYEYIAGIDGSSGGLELMAGQGQGCDDVGTFLVEFGYDGVSCCVLSLTREALKNHCEGAGTHINPDDGFTPRAFRNTSSVVTHIGVYGNADPLDVTQWLELPFASSTDTASWDNEKGICSSVVSALEYRMLYASVGSKRNPQNKIISAEARYGKTEWIWREEAAEEQNFLVCNSVSFKEHDLDEERYAPPSPPMAFKVPWDVFYPFSAATTSEATGTVSAWSSPQIPSFLVGSAFVIGPLTSIAAETFLR